MSVCRRSDTNIINEKYDYRFKWFLIFIYTITAVIYVILFAFVCCMLNTTNVLLFASVCYIFHTVGVLGMCTFFFVHFSPYSCFYIILCNLTFYIYLQLYTFVTTRTTRTLPRRRIESSSSPGSSSSTCLSSGLSCGRRSGGGQFPCRRFLHEHVHALALANEWAPGCRMVDHPLLRHAPARPVPSTNRLWDLRDVLDTPGLLHDRLHRLVPQAGLHHLANKLRVGQDEIAGERAALVEHGGRGEKLSVKLPMICDVVAVGMGATGRSCERRPSRPSP